MSYRHDSVRVQWLCITRQWKNLSYAGRIPAGFSSCAQWDNSALHDTGRITAGFNGWHNEATETRICRQNISRVQWLGIMRQQKLELCRQNTSRVNGYAQWHNRTQSDAGRIAAGPNCRVGLHATVNRVTACYMTWRDMFIMIAMQAKY